MDYDSLKPEKKKQWYAMGQGNWGAVKDLNFDVKEILDASMTWKLHTAGIEKGWLVWNVLDDWCYAQQQLVESVGWIPIVGFDPRVGPPKKLTKGAIVIDFNKALNLPVLYPHFPVELMWQFIDKLAFWHSDLLIRRPLMTELASKFEHMKNGVTAATYQFPGWRNIFTKQRYWELVGCTTKAASLNQFENGTGWWMAFADHPNCPSETEYRRRKRAYWDHGSGIHYWKKRYHGEVLVINDDRLHEGHCTKINNPNYVGEFDRTTSDSQRSMNKELAQNFSLREICEKLSLPELVLDLEHPNNARNS